MTAEELKGHLDLLLLSAVAEGPSHGYLLIERLRARSGDAFDLPEGTVYPALHRLERDGLLASAWTAASGRRRRVYRLTRRGRSTLARRHAEWRSFSRAVEAVIG
jgi:PadR family transcriptional regulator, regulatory protein PadR